MKQQQQIAILHTLFEEMTQHWPDDPAQLTGAQGYRAWHTLEQVRDHFSPQVRDHTNLVSLAKFKYQISADDFMDIWMSPKYKHDWKRQQTFDILARSA